VKYLKRILKIISIIILTLIVSLFVFLGIDDYNTSYLDIKNNPAFHNTSYLITNVNVVPMSKDTVLMNKKVLVKNGIIEEIADSITEDGIEVIDAKNMFLSPGLIDMHMHLWDEYELGLYLANGVTTIRNLWGMPIHLRVKEAINNQEIIGPMFFTTSPKLTGQNDYGDDKVQIGTPEKAKELVKQYKKRGYDFIKTNAGLPENIFNAIIEQSIESEISIIAHPSREISYKSHFHPQIASIEHAEEIIQQALKYQLDSAKIEPIVQLYVLNKKSFCPTLTGYYKIFEMLEEGQNVLESDLVHYINPLIQSVDSKVQYDRWAGEKENNSSIIENINRQHKFHLYILKRMNEEGVNIVCGTDAGIGITAPGYSIHQELKLYQDAGMNSYEVLKTATVNPSNTHEAFKKLGTIENGKWANFILSQKNPLTNLNTLSHPEWVMIQGRKINKNQLNEFAKKAFDRNNFVATAVRYVEYMIVEK
jgi:hypothetical protein